MTRRRRAGITQLELLISLVIMGMLAVLLANALDFNRRSLDRARFQSKTTEHALARNALRDWIEDMPLDYVGQTAQDFLEGSKNSLRFRSVVTDGSFDPSKVAEFYVVGNEGTLEVKAFGRHPSKGVPLQFQRVLSEGISKLTFRYFGRLSNTPEARWYDLWHDKTYLPELVKIEWVSKNNGPTPPLVLQPAKNALQSEMSLSSLVPPG